MEAFWVVLAAALAVAIPALATASTATPARSQRLRRRESKSVRARSIIVSRRAEHPACQPATINCNLVY